MQRDSETVRLVLRGRSVAAQRARSSFATRTVTASSMMAAMSPEGILWRRRQRARSIFASSSALAVNCTL
jgi:hypothetical protein